MPWALLCLESSPVPTSAAGPPLSLALSSHLHSLMVQECSGELIAFPGPTPDALPSEFLDDVRWGGGYNLQRALFPGGSFQLHTEFSLWSGLQTGAERQQRGHPHQSTPEEQTGSCSAFVLVQIRMVFELGIVDGNRKHGLLYVISVS